MVRQEKEIKGIQIGKEEVKLSLFADKIMYIEKPVVSIKNLLDPISEFGKTVGYKVNIQKSMAFLYINNEISEMETRKKIPFTIVTRKIKYLGINLTKERKDLYSLDSVPFLLCFYHEWVLDFIKAFSASIDMIK